MGMSPHSNASLARRYRREVIGDEALGQHMEAIKRSLTDGHR